MDSRNDVDVRLTGIGERQRLVGNTNVQGSQHKLNVGQLVLVIVKHFRDSQREVAYSTVGVGGFDSARFGEDDALRNDFSR